MTRFHFKAILQKTGWLENALVETDANGIIISIRENTVSDQAESIDGYALPGFQNAHSHAFQYAMAGLAENHSVNGQKSDFWSWREAMYRLALAIDPDQLEAIAAMLYGELLRHGYTNVAEFHYLHHDRDGQWFADPAEMGARLISAAKKTGIGITLIPIFYQKGGFEKSPQPEQKRFISATIDDYFKLFEATRNACTDYEHANTGIGIHSMRGVEPELIRQICEEFPRDVPLHLHISEQLQEVADCLKVYGKKPVQWMLDNIDLSERFHFVHATHIDAHETGGLGERQVNVVLCPTTEGNLGDGIFPLRDFQSKGGHWSIGTDSHISLNPFEELRLLDYGQRLTSHRRNIFVDDENGSSAAYALEQATINGRRAMNNFQTEYFAAGEPFNACVISNEHPLIQTSSDNYRLNTILYSADETMHLGTISFGKWRSKNSRHINQAEISADFVKTIGELGNR